MFSEYASKFLAQSQSRLSTFAGQQQQTDHDSSAGAGTAGPSRPRRNDWFSSRPARPPGRSLLNRGSRSSNDTNANPSTGPYNPATAATAASRFGFASRISAAQDAPLFQSAHSEFRDDDADPFHPHHHQHHHDYDDDDDDDDDREDLLALQRSRRVGGASKLTDSGETGGDTSRESLDGPGITPTSFRDHQKPRANLGSTRSGWATKRPYGRRRDEERDALLEDPYEDRSSIGSDRGPKASMVDVGLESHMETDVPPGTLLAESLDDKSPPAFQKFKDRGKQSFRRESILEGFDDLHHLQSLETEDNGAPSRGQGQEGRGRGARRETGRLDGGGNTAVPAVPLLDGDIFKYDGFFACSFIILQFALLTTFFLVWLQTTTPSGPIGDTVYSVLRASFHMLAVDTLVAVVVALFWLAALRSFVRPLVALVVLATPVVLLVFSFYPFISSFGGSTHGDSFQDRAMRWAAVVPAVCAVLWVYLVARVRRSLSRAIEVIEFSSRILAQNPALLLLGLACLGLIVAWTWVWLVMFNRVFLEGRFSRTLARWVMSMSSWWLGAWFVLMHMWTVAVIAHVQRAATAATVSQWYFHRNAEPRLSSRQIVAAAVRHALTKVFGSICESTLLSLLIRLPLLLLPSRLSVILQRAAALWIPTPLVALTNPLTITFAAIHSQGLAYSAKGLSQMDFLQPELPATHLTPRALAAASSSSSSSSSSSPLLPYRLAKMILLGTRYIMATALGFAGWVFMAKNMIVDMPDGMGWRGSAYAYVVGIVASFIGFYIMGTMEGVLGGIIDAVVICYGSERRIRGDSSVGAYCMEAAYLLGGRGGGHGGTIVYDES